MALEPSQRAQEPEGGDVGTPPVSETRRVMRRLWSKRPAKFGILVLLGVVFLAVFAPYITDYQPDAMDIPKRFMPPSREHLFGTDEFGRDLFTRIVYGSRYTLQIGFISVTIALITGSLIGLVSGYFGGWVDIVLMRFIDLMLAFPGMIIALGVVAILGPSLQNSMIAVGIGSMPSYARVVRASVLSVKEKEFVESARAGGLSNMRILFRHVLPNVLSPLIVLATLGLPGAILSAAGLSFLGLGAQPPTPEWGSILNSGRAFLRQAPWVTTFPGLAIMFVVLAFNLLGNELRDVLDPRLK